MQTEKAAILTEPAATNTIDDKNIVAESSLPNQSQNQPRIKNAPKGQQNWLGSALWYPDRCQKCGKVFDKPLRKGTTLFFEWKCSECEHLNHLHWRDIKFHPAAEIFPMIEGPDFDALMRDIEANGLQKPITLFGDKILDGRNRYLACLKTGVRPDFEQYYGNLSPTDYVISLNLRRRHLNESQRAMIAARIADMKQGTRTDLALNEAKSQTEAAELLSISRSNVQRARKVLQNGTPELVKEVESGKIAVSRAAEMLTPKTKPEYSHDPKDYKHTGPCVGMMHAENAIWQLEKIAKQDTEHRDALDCVGRWILRKLKEEFGETSLAAFQRWNEDIHAAAKDAAFEKSLRSRGAA